MMVGAQAPGSCIYQELVDLSIPGPPLCGSRSRGSQGHISPTRVPGGYRVTHSLACRRGRELSWPIHRALSLLLLV